MTLSATRTFGSGTAVRDLSTPAIAIRHGDRRAAVRSGRGAWLRHRTSHPRGNRIDLVGDLQHLRKRLRLRVRVPQCWGGVHVHAHTQGGEGGCSRARRPCCPGPGPGAVWQNVCTSLTGPIPPSATFARTQASSCATSRRASSAVGSGVWRLVVERYGWSARVTASHSGSKVRRGDAAPGTSTT